MGEEFKSDKITLENLKDILLKADPDRLTFNNSIKDIEEYLADTESTDMNVLKRIVLDEQGNMHIYNNRELFYTDHDRKTY